jgi:hypothetical protein
MQESKEPLRGTLNLRIGGKLEAEIERIAAAKGKTASETARFLLGYGVEVQRRLDAQRLMQHHEAEFTDDTPGRVEINAEFVPYSWDDVARLNGEFHEAMSSEWPPQRKPTWDDLAP